MARVSLCIVLLSAVMAFSQQQPQSQDTPTTATANPSGNKSPSQDDSQNQSNADANQRIQSSIQNLLSDHKRNQARHTRPESFFIPASTCLRSCASGHTEPQAAARAGAARGSPRSRLA